MAKATITVVRTGLITKATGMGPGRITQARVHFTTTGETIHAEDLKLRRLSRFFLQPLNIRWRAAGSIVNTQAENNYASITISSIRHGGTVRLVDGSAQNYYLLAIGE